MRRGKFFAGSTRPRAILFVGAFSVATAVAATTTACTDISDSSTAVLSLQFDSLPSPSVVIGDTLRDTTGAVVFPSVHAFNFKGEEIPLAPIYFQSPDSGVTVDSATGVITGDSLRGAPARIIATIGNLQAIQRVSVTLSPTSIAAVDGLDTLKYSLLDTTLNVSNLLTVRLAHGVSPSDSAVTNYLVSFSIVSQSSPNVAELLNDGGRLSRVDTTDANGIAGRKIRVHPLNLASGPVDSVIVEATAKYRGQPVTGSPVRLVVVLEPRS